MSQDEIALEPLATPTPVVILNPINPVAQFYSDYKKAYDYAFAVLVNKTNEDPSFIKYKMDVIAHMSRIQKVLSPALRLNAFISDEYWEGRLFGMFQGTGQVSGNLQQASFTINFENGRITGKLINNRLAGIKENIVSALDNNGQEADEGSQNDFEYKMDSGVEIMRSDAGYYASYNNGELYSLMYIEKDNLYFALDKKSSIIYPEARHVWADWGLENGQFVLFGLEDLNIHNDSDMEIEDINLENINN